MKAVVQRAYGAPREVLELRDIDEPDAEDDEVLVRVRSASVHPDIWHVVRGEPYVLRVMGAGLRRPKAPVPGTDVAGHVERVGENVTRFQPGDEVFGESVRGHQWRNGGAFAEYVSVPEDALALKPVRISFEQAAAVPTSGSIALSGLRDQGRMQPGHRVLINGAGGGVGTFAVQLATAHGADVTGVDVASKLDMLRAIGADRVIDATREDFTRGSEPYDLILDVPGNHPFSACRRALMPGGRYVLIGHDQFGRAGGRWLGSLPRFLRLMAISPFVRQLPPPSFSLPNKKESMELLRELIEAGRITPVIDRVFPLSEVSEAIRHLEEGDARGKVVVSP